MQEFTFIVDASSEGQRIDLFLTEHMEGQSRSYLQKLLKDGAVHVGGKIAKSNYKVRTNDQICLELPDPVELEVEARAMDLDILYEETERLFKRCKATRELCELRNMINIGYLITRQAMERKESRGPHYTIDYPPIKK